MYQNRFIVARAKGQAVKTKTAGMQPSFFLPPFFPQRDAGGKGWLDNKARKPASGNRGITAFFWRDECPFARAWDHYARRENLCFPPQ